MYCINEEESTQAFHYYLIGWAVVHRIVVYRIAEAGFVVV
jgi:hypothetical protein